MFRKAALAALRKGQVEAVFNMGFVAHHMIRFTGDALAGRENASFYAVKEHGAPTAPGHLDREAA